MRARVLSGTAVAEAIKAELRPRIETLRGRGVTPGLAAVLVGEDPASQVYVRMKVKTCRELGLFSDEVRLPPTTTEAELLAVVDRLNADPGVHGILVQLPLPPQVGAARVLERVNPRKDVDCFHPTNVGLMATGRPAFLPCTPAGVQQLLIRGGVETAGRHAVIVGRSNIVGRPLAIMLSHKGPGANATVTLCHSGTKDLAALTSQADILIAAIGVPEFVRAGMVRDGAAVIDVGVNRVDDPAAKGGARLVGDVAFKEVAAKAGLLTPVPGGVGPMTIAMLVHNTVLAAERFVAGAASD
jgi:methylenetetrahydrofolate dehydrogenase (NADP+)/methenyltetrahydrofolate cyclohydrolase